METKNIEEKWGKALLIASYIGLAFIGGYITGRLTAVSDLKNGKLNEFIPKK